MITYFVESGKIAKQTFTNYLKDLLKNGKIKKDYDVRLDALVYFVPEEEKVNLKVLIDNKEFDDLIDKMTEAEAKETLKELVHGDI